MKHMQDRKTKTHTLTDDAVIIKILEWKQEYFSELVDRYADKLGKYIFTLVNYNKQLSNDCLQEVFLKVWEKLPQYQIGTNFNAWIYRLTHNTVINVLQQASTKDQHYAGNDLNETLLADTENILDIADENFRKALVKKMLTSIDEKYRAIILLYYYEEKSYEEIAEILEISVNTVGTQLSRAKKQIQKQLNTDQSHFYFA